MKKGAVLINAFSGIGEHQALRLQEEFLKRGVELPIIKNQLGAVPLDLDYCVFLDKDIYTAKLLERRGVRLFNSASAIEVCDDKMLTYIALKDEASEPLTLSSSFTYRSTPVADEEIDFIVNALSLPLVFKLNKSSLGAGVFLVSSREELKSYVEKFRLVPHVYQKYIAHSKGRDVRVIVVGDKVVAQMTRVNENDFRSNVELGGSAVPCEIDEATRKEAVKVSKILGLDYCGIDFLFDENGSPFVCEVNSNAFFRGIESVSGVNVAGCYAEYILANV